MPKKKQPVYSSWDEVNRALKEIVEIEFKIMQVEGVMNEKINTIKTEADSKTAPLVATKKVLEQHIKAYTEYNIGEFKDSKTRQMSCGEVGFRQSVGVITRNIKAIVGALKQHKMWNCIITKESINKEELAKYDDEALAKIGARRKTEDKFWYKPYVERVEK